MKIVNQLMNKKLRKIQAQHFQMWKNTKQWTMLPVLFQITLMSMLWSTLPLKKKKSKSETQSLMQNLFLPQERANIPQISWEKSTSMKKDFLSSISQESMVYIMRIERYHYRKKNTLLQGSSTTRGGVSAGAAGALHPRFFGNSLFETKKMEGFIFGLLITTTVAISIQHLTYSYYLQRLC